MQYRTVVFSLFLGEGSFIYCSGPSAKEPDGAMGPPGMGLKAGRTGGTGGYGEAALALTLPRIHCAPFPYLESKDQKTITYWGVCSFYTGFNTSGSPSSPPTGNRSLRIRGGGGW